MAHFHSPHPPVQKPCPDSPAVRPSWLHERGGATARYLRQKAQLLSPYSCVILRCEGSPAAPHTIPSAGAYQPSAEEL